MAVAFGLPVSTQAEKIAIIDRFKKRLGTVPRLRVGVKEGLAAIAARQDPHHSCQ